MMGKSAMHEILLVMQANQELDFLIIRLDRLVHKANPTHFADQPYFL